VLSEHTSYTSRTERKVRVAVLRLLMRHLYPRADALVAVSEAQAADLRRSGRWASTFATVIQNGVDPLELQGLADQTAQPHPWLAPQRDQPTAVFAGRLETVKGIDVLLQAWERVLARTPARLLIVGSGGQDDALQAQARALPDGGASVAFVPFQSNPFPFISQADVFVLPSRKEGFPIVLLEAMALGRACVATDCPTGPRELVGENEHGLLVPPQDPDSLAEALMHALSEPALRARLGASARMRAAQLSAHSTAQRYLDVLLPEGLADTTGLRS
jgi:glycosyltransferase involved in cell wall biosynthesis